MTTPVVVYYGGGMATNTAASNQFGPTVEWVRRSTSFPSQILVREPVTGTHWVVMAGRSEMADDLTDGWAEAPEDDGILSGVVPVWIVNCDVSEDSFESVAAHVDEEARTLAAEAG